MAEWRWYVWLIIPVGGRSLAGDVLTRIWDDVDEDKNYDGIRLSADGTPPVTHLMAVIPAMARQAKLMKLLCQLAGDDDPDFPDGINPSAQDIATYQAIRTASNKFVVAITDRLDGNGDLIRSNFPVRYIDDRLSNVTQIRDIDARS